MYAKLFYILLAALVACTPRAYAQKQLKHLAKGLEKTAVQKALPEFSVSLNKLTVGAVSAASQTGRKPGPELLRRRQAQLEQAKAAARARIAEKVRVTAPSGYLSRAAKANLKMQKMAAFDARALETTVLLQDPTMKSYAPFSASAFFIEEMFGGKKHLWGVTAAHVADIMGPQACVYLTLPEGITLEYPVKFTVKGNAGMADIALFPVEGELAGLVRPIPLAQTTPGPQEKLRSYGYFDDAFHIVRNRTVLANTPGRLVTSFEFGAADRAGACGGPVLNESNELVGVHCGSSESKSQSYAVPAAHVKDLLYAARHGGYRLRPLVLNGQTVGQINVDEYIQSFNVKKNGASLRQLQPWHQEARVDYEHLETLLPLKGADEVEILLVKGGTVETGADSHAVKTLISIDLNTGEVTRAGL